MSAVTIPVMESVAVGSLVRDWRTRRRRSQLDLALDTGISARHLSFVETGRSNPSPDLLLKLADQLELSLRERNRLLLAAGYAPRFQQRELEAPEMRAVREALGHVLAGHEPYPALAVDRHWNLVASNAALDLLLEGAAPELLQPPVNCMRLALHPRGLVPRILNLAEWRGHLLARLRREITLHGDPQVEALLHEVSAYPTGRPSMEPRMPRRSWSSCTLHRARASCVCSARSPPSAPRPTSRSPSCRWRPSSRPMPPPLRRCAERTPEPP